MDIAATSTLMHRIPAVNAPPTRSAQFTQWGRSEAACSASCESRDIVLSATLLSISTSISGPRLMEPSVTRAPACTVTGSDSPVIHEQSRSVARDCKTPSAGMRSPDRTRTKSPGRRLHAAMSPGSGRTRWASRGGAVASFSRSAEVFARILASTHRAPRSRNTNIETESK